MQFSFSKFITLISCSAIPEATMAYIGPGAGIEVIGSLIAVSAVALIAVFGVLWYPIRRLRARRKKRKGE